MTPQELKNSILQLAIQGKLVEQRPEEGTAEELFARIQEEKQRLIAEKKIKKEKPLLEITEDEKPFDIPESWMWVRLGNIIKSLSAGGDKPTVFSKEKTDTCTVQVLSNGEKNQGIFGYTDMPVVTERSLTISGRGTIGYAEIRTEPYVPIVRLLVILPLEHTYLEYLKIVIQASTEYGIGSAVKQLTVPMLLPKLIPLPPLAEQKRIVAKIEELLPYIDRYEQAWSKLEQFNSRFPEDMKKSLLQYAIQGKLVEQRPEEGTAEELFAQIQREKQRLIDEKKIKKEKPLSEITEDEKPFDIPESWKWVRLSSIASKITDGEHKTPHRVDSYQGFYLLSARNIRDGYILLDDVDYVDAEEFKKISLRCNPQKGDILISCSGSVGRCSIVEDDNLYVMVRSAAMVAPVLLDSKYLMYTIQSEVVQGQIRNKTKQTAQANLFQEAIRNLIIPLPPLAEQKRMVEKLEQLLPLCEKLI